MEMTYYCTRCDKELNFNINSNRYEIDKVGYIDDSDVLCNECYLGEKQINGHR